MSVRTGCSPVCKESSVWLPLPRGTDRWGNVVCVNCATNYGSVEELVSKCDKCNVKKVVVIGLALGGTRD